MLPPPEVAPGDAAPARACRRRERVPARQALQPAGATSWLFTGAQTRGIEGFQIIVTPVGLNPMGFFLSNKSHGLLTAFKLRFLGLVARRR
jgi:hypothetical protein